ncbi:hypothetical protein [Pseudomonas serbica]|uniref:hypothetical protein n=1 Tax=Pseudomonas serbica TaxID=2965074 RepID=UPI00237A4A49|nr:hypothetical protein [Pseudomonas serbica]
MLKCRSSGTIDVANGYLTADGLFIRGTKIALEDWDDFSLVVKYCKPYLESALAKAFDPHIGELYEASPGRLALKPGRSPQAQFAAVADSFKGDPITTKILIGWCVLLNLEIQVGATLMEVDPEDDFDEDLDDGYDEVITDLELGSIASYFLAGPGWSAAFKVPLPQHCRGRLVDIPEEIRDQETAVFNRHRFDKPLAVGVPGIGSCTDVSAFSIAALSWGDVLVTRTGTCVGVFIDHFVESKTDLSEWLGTEGLTDKVISIDENGENLRFRVHQKMEYACFRLQPSQPSGFGRLKING